MVEWKHLGIYGEGKASVAGSTVALVVSVASCLLNIIIIIIIRNRRRASRLSHEFPRGPPAWPIIGHLPLLRTAPHRVLADLCLRQGYGPLIGLRLGSQPAVIVSSVALAKELLHTHDKTFANRPPYQFTDLLGYGFGTAVIFSSYNPHWSGLRKIYTLELFTTKRLQQLQHIRQDEVRGLLHRLLERSLHGTRAVDVGRLLSEMTSNTTARLLQSKTLAEAAPEFPELIRGLESEGIPIIGDFISWLKFLDGPKKRRMKHLHDRIDRIIDSILVERRQLMARSPPDEIPQDFLQVLLCRATGNEGELLTVKEIKGIMLAAVHALLQAVLDIASRGDGVDRDTHVFVQRSISRQLTPLQDSINQQFLVRKSSAENWFWSQQHPLAVASFVDLLESDSRFTSVTSVGWEGVSVCPSKASDVCLITLAISSAAAIAKLGAAKLSCPLCFSTMMDEIGRLMDMLVSFLPIDQVYNFTSSVGLRSQFLGHFGSRAVSYQDTGKLGGEEGAFWVDLVQQLLRGSIVREHIRTKLTSYDSIEVLERDLAVFGFFAALGRRTQSFLSANGSVDSDERIAGLLRYLIGASTVFYPQLASLNTYQFFIEVVCEEMDWLPFFPVSSPSSDHLFHGHNEPLPSLNLEATSKALEQCSRWIGDFMKYSTWVQQPDGARARTFLSKSKVRLDECILAYSTAGQRRSSNKWSTNAELNGLPYEDQGADGRGNQDDTKKASLVESDAYNRSLESSKRTKEQLADFEGSQKMEQLKLFDKELQGVDEALSRLECLLLEQEGPGKEHLTAACTNLKTIRQLKKEVETLEASLRKKATSMLQADSSSLQRQRRQKGKRDKISSQVDRETSKQQGKNRTSNGNIKSEGIAKFIPFLSNKSSSTASEFNTLEGEGFEQAAALALQEASTVSKEIQHFEVLRQELMDLEKRIQESAGEHLNDREIECQIDGDDTIDTQDGLSIRSDEAVKGDVVSKSLQKIKDTSTDVWKGTQLLATDVAAAVVLLRRSASGEELTEREKKSLKRTLTDLASIIPIGFLMLLPVTAVGHAAILAAIQRYVPALIPSAYAHERLQLMKQLEKVKEMESADVEDESGFSSTPSDTDRIGEADD